MNMIPRSILLILCLFSTFGWAAQTRLDMAGLVKLLLAQGYHDIREVELEGDKFEVDTLNADDQRVQLQVDANTGEITKKEAIKEGTKEIVNPAALLSDPSGNDRL